MFAEDLLYCLIVPMVKVSILLQYKSIFVMRKGEVMYTVVHCLIWIVVISYAFVIIAAAVLVSHSTQSNAFES